MKYYWIHILSIFLVQEHVTGFETLPTPPKEVWPQLVIGGKEDLALGHIEKIQKEVIKKPYGDVLDAGTGIYSLSWLAGLMYRYHDPKSELFMKSFVAVTADPNFQKEVRAKADELGIGEKGQILLGNWAANYNYNDYRKGFSEDSCESPSANIMDVAIQKGEYLCEDQMFDTILADYLVGAVDYFAPFFQDLLFERLGNHLKPDGVLYLTGLNPIPEKADSVATDLFCEVTKLRDACILLARSRPYREHPPDFVVRHLEQSNFKVLDVVSTITVIKFILQEVGIILTLIIGYVS